MLQCEGVVDGGLVNEKEHHIRKHAHAHSNKVDHQARTSVRQNDMAQSSAMQ